MNTVFTQHSSHNNIYVMCVARAFVVALPGLVSLPHCTTSSRRHFQQAPLPAVATSSSRHVSLVMPGSHLRLIVVSHQHHISVSPCAQLTVASTAKSAAVIASHATGPLSARRQRMIGASPCSLHGIGGEQRDSIRAFCRRPGLLTALLIPPCR